MRELLHGEITFFFYTKRLKSQNFPHPYRGEESPPRTVCTLFVKFLNDEYFGKSPILTISESTTKRLLPVPSSFILTIFLIHFALQNSQLYDVDRLSLEKTHDRVAIEWLLRPHKNTPTEFYMKKKLQKAQKLAV